MKLYFLFICPVGDVRFWGEKNVLSQEETIMSQLLAVCLDECSLFFFAAPELSRGLIFFRQHKPAASSSRGTRCCLFFKLPLMEKKASFSTLLLGVLLIGELRKC